MAKEIERKFLLRELPAAATEVKPLAVEQGYITLGADGREVRLRAAAGLFWLTVKSEGEMERQEYEIQISEQQFNTLWPLTEGRRIQKRRYVLSISGHQVEIDQYDLPLKGLLVAEVEFPSLKAAKAYTKEPWMGREATHLNFLKNKNLLQFPSYQELLDQLENTGKE